jgi:hypothetical protein
MRARMYHGQGPSESRRLAVAGLKAVNAKLVLARELKIETAAR